MKSDNRYNQEVEAIIRQLEEAGIKLNGRDDGPYRVDFPSWVSSAECIKISFHRGISGEHDRISFGEFRARVRINSGMMSLMRQTLLALSEYRYLSHPKDVVSGTVFEATLSDSLQLAPKKVTDKKLPEQFKVVVPFTGAVGEMTIEPCEEDVAKEYNA
jgi:hypothetical protein